MQLLRQHGNYAYMFRWQPRVEGQSYNNAKLDLTTQAENIDTMCASMLKLAQTHCPSLVTEATILFGKFK